MHKFIIWIRLLERGVLGAYPPEAAGKMCVCVCVCVWGGGGGGGGCLLHKVQNLHE